MRVPTICLAATALALLMSGCAQHQPASSSDTLAEIRYQVGPCYGTCPVYSVAVEADGTTRFTGERHTATEGERTLAGDATTFSALQTRLASWQPNMGTTQQTLDCEPRATDLPQYTVTWINGEGEQAVLEHDTGCHSDSGRELTNTLRSLNKELNIEQWVQQ
ncbi:MULTISPECIES: DUF6438 domain-containing protein [Halomonas]|uniref:DUF6438 domain-containing protein n=1 Tax=Halomonas casei TaxID=2742613 RepID=A0ABR9EZK4_9GAMM|nr:MULTISPECIES: DUF6438 domain-containing protein [Halomonas]MBE0399596.1 hypothetical protein [Halomonas casei]PCC23394.1 hypothetical protein CIK78_15795 [Halomonas sp. JB37]